MEKFYAEIHSIEDDMCLKVEYRGILWTVTPDRTRYGAEEAMKHFLHVIEKHYRRFIGHDQGSQSG